MVPDDCQLTLHTVLAITVESPDNKNFEILDFLLKIYLFFIFTLQGPQKSTLQPFKTKIEGYRTY